MTWPEERGPAPQDEDAVAISVPFQMWLWTGHRIAHWLGWNFGVVESRIVPMVTRPGEPVVVTGVRCTGCGRWEA